MPGPLPRNGVKALTPAERMAAYRERLNASLKTGKPPVVVRYRRPADRPTKPQRSRAAVAPADLLDDYQAWHDSLSASLADSAILDRLDERLTPRDRVGQLAVAEPPKSFGRNQGHDRPERTNRRV